MDTTKADFRKCVKGQEDQWILENKRHCPAVWKQAYIVKLHTVSGEAELYDPAQGAFAVAGVMTQRRDSHTAILLNHRDVLLTGGDAWGGIALYYGSFATAELYHPAKPVPRRCCSPS
jgi:hypothetical protein